MARKIVVDGSNVAYEEQTKDGRPKLANLQGVRRELERRGYDPVIVVDASFRHEVDDERRYERLVDDGVIHQAPAGTDADEFILKLAEDFDARIVSNDRYERYRDRYPRLGERRVPLMIVDGTIEFSGLDHAERR